MIAAATEDKLNSNLKIEKEIKDNTSGAYKSGLDALQTKGCKAIFMSNEGVVKECYAFDFSAGDILINCFTGTFFNGTLWFLYALFWSYVLMWIALAVVRFIRNRRTLHPGLAGENTNLLTFNKFTPPRLLNYLTIGGIIFLTHVIVRVAIRDNDCYDIRMFRNALM